LAFERAGRSMPARMAIIAITTSNSINVNARTLFLEAQVAWRRDKGMELFKDDYEVSGDMIF
jgi:hypothetical protein